LNGGNRLQHPEIFYMTGSDPARTHALGDFARRCAETLAEKGRAERSNPGRVPFIAAAMSLRGKPRDA